MQAVAILLDGLVDAALKEYGTGRLAYCYHFSNDPQRVVGMIKGAAAIDHIEEAQSELGKPLALAVEGANGRCKAVLIQEEVVGIGKRSTATISTGWGAPGVPSVVTGPEPTSRTRAVPSLLR
jgi:hypothetical protein